MESQVYSNQAAEQCQMQVPEQQVEQVGQVVGFEYNQSVVQVDNKVLAYQVANFVELGKDPTLYQFWDTKVPLKVVHRKDHNQVDNLEHMLDNQLDNSHLLETIVVPGRTAALKEVADPVLGTDLEVDIDPEVCIDLEVCITLEVDIDPEACIDLEVPPPGCKLLP